MPRSLTGNVYGDIKAIAYIGNKKYKCQCVKCGNITEKFSANLKGTLSCSNCNKGYKIDLTGKIYGFLKVIGYNKETKKWICECKCGKLTEVKSNNLKSGNTTSCGICSSVACAQQDVVAGTRVSQLNSKIYSNNKSGVKGVGYKQRKSKWYATIRFQGVSYWLGYYAKKEDAIKARKQAEEKLHGDFLEWYKMYKRNNTKTKS